MADNNRKRVITKGDKWKLGIEGIYDEDERIITMIASFRNRVNKKKSISLFF